MAACTRARILPSSASCDASNVVWRPPLPAAPPAMAASSSSSGVGPLVAAPAVFLGAVLAAFTGVRAGLGGSGMADVGLEAGTGGRGADVASRGRAVASALAAAGFVGAQLPLAVGLSG
eukprot:7377015-Prymnesium_polylepis.1